MDPEESAALPGEQPAAEEVAEEDQADDELNPEIDAREVDVVAGDDLPREGYEQHESGDDLDDLPQSEPAAGVRFAGKAVRRFGCGRIDRATGVAGGVGRAVATAAAGGATAGAVCG